MPRELLDRLAEGESSRAAINTPAVRLLTDLRNALAHGGNAYLDDRGSQPDGQAAMLAFVGAVMKGGRITRVNVLRIGERDYRQFLAARASWLRQAGITAALNERAA